MKQKLSPVAVIIILLVVVGVAGVLMYFSSEPPVVGTQRSFEQERQRMEATRDGMKGMFAPKDPAKSAPEKKGDPKSTAPTTPKPDSTK